MFTSKEERLIKCLPLGEKTCDQPFKYNRLIGLILVEELSGCDSLSLSANHHMLCITGHLIEEGLQFRISNAQICMDMTTTIHEYDTNTNFTNKK